MILGPVGFAHPWLLLFLPLALLPLWRHAAADFTYPSLAILPHDRLSNWLERGRRLMTALAIAATVTALAAPFRAEVLIERVGQGAEIVLLLDRSRSMDQPFAGDPRASWWAASAETKAKVASRRLAQFVQRRGHDRIGLIEFSTLPIRITGFTAHAEVTEAALRASDLGRGLAETDMGRALLAALSYFKDRRYVGARIILLASDGGAELDDPTRARITGLMRQYHVALYWLYVRSYRSPGLFAQTDIEAEGDGAAAPERVLHKFFQSMGTPDQAYEAQDPQALRRAIEDINHLEALPIRYVEILPRSLRSRLVYAVALIVVLLLLGTQWLEIERWV
jgi:mxaC protein